MRSWALAAAVALTVSGTASAAPYLHYPVAKRAAQARAYRQAGGPALLTEHERESRTRFLFLAEWRYTDRASGDPVACEQFLNVRLIRGRIRTSVETPRLCLHDIF